MDRELARKLPAQTVKVTQAPHLPRRVRWRAPSEGALTAVVTNQARLGRIGRTYRLGQDDRGWWAEVVLLAERPKRPRWIKPLAILAGLTVVLAAAAWLVLLAVQALVAILPYLIAGAVVLAVLGALAAPRVISVVQSVTIK
jgi:hypothetical protein